MLGEHPAMVGRGVATRLRRDPCFDPFSGIRGLVAAGDLTIGNLEGAISDWPRFCMPSDRECRAPGQAIAALAASGFTALTLANNHLQQHGERAVRETISLLEANGIAVVGLAGREAGRCRPVDLDIRGVRVRLLGYSLRPRQHFTTTPLYAEGIREGILRDIAEGRAAGALVIVSIHWGDEFVAVPSREQMVFGREMVAAGCSIVLGHHPHVLQGWERHGRGAILYSLGNLVFDMPWLPSLRRTALADCLLSEDGCESVAWHPLELDAWHRPQPAGDPAASEVRSFLEDSQTHLARGEGAWSAPAPETYLRLVAAAQVGERWARNRYFLRRLHRYRIDVSGQLIGKFLLRRMGLLRD